MLQLYLWHDFYNTFQNFSGSAPSPQKKENNVHVPEEQHKCGRIAHIGTFEVDRQGKESKKGNATCRKKKKKGDWHIYIHYTNVSHTHTIEQEIP